MYLLVLFKHNKVWQPLIIRNCIDQVQCMILALRASASPRNLLEINMLRLHPKLSESETLRGNSVDQEMAPVKNKCHVGTPSKTCRSSRDSGRTVFLNTELIPLGRASLEINFLALHDSYHHIAMNFGPNLGLKGKSDCPWERRMERWYISYS